MDDSLPVIMVGSHLDSVNSGGNFDGPLGFLGGLELARSLREDGRQTRHPIVVAVFAGEEAVRFADTCLGSKILAGQVGTEEAAKAAGPQRGHRR